MPQINSMTQLCLSMASKKGTYALLLGSGISSAAGIPTGWDITLDMVKMLASIRSEDCSDDPEGWYKRTFDESPDYSKLLEVLWPQPTDRHLQIRPYIEKLQDDEDEKNRRPSEAHRAIATLVSRGYVKVIVTTNFDRLIETALQAVGVAPSVIASDDDMNGKVLPMVHNSCTVIKVHGDYYDTRIRNTVQELTVYPDKQNDLLRQVFTEYNLVICGWSGKWDTALRVALTENPSPWFSTYCSARSTVNAETQEVIDRRSAKVILGMNANDFFTALEQGMTSIEEIRGVELITPAIAQASMKRFVTDPVKRTRVSDLIVAETGRLLDLLSNEASGQFMETVSAESVSAKLEYYESETEILRVLYSTGCFWSEGTHSRTWTNGLVRLTQFPLIHGQYFEAWKELREYPVLLAMYAGGMGSLAFGNLSNVAAILGQTKVPIGNSDRDLEPLILNCNADGLSESSAIRTIHRNNYQSDWVSRHLRRSNAIWMGIEDMVPLQISRHRIFDLFEYLIGISYADTMLSYERPLTWAPKGYLASRFPPSANLEYAQNFVQTEIDEAGSKSDLLTHGLFGGSLVRLESAKQAFDLLFTGRRQ